MATDALQEVDTPKIKMRDEKRDKSERKKRAREEETPTEAERKHKKPKSLQFADSDLESNPKLPPGAEEAANHKGEKKRKEKKHRKDKEEKRAKKEKSNKNNDHASNRSELPSATDVDDAEHEQNARHIPNSTAADPMEVDELDANPAVRAEKKEKKKKKKKQKHEIKSDASRSEASTLHHLPSSSDMLATEEKTNKKHKKHKKHKEDRVANGADEADASPVQNAPIAADGVDTIMATEEQRGNSLEDQIASNENVERSKKKSKKHARRDEPATAPQPRRHSASKSPDDAFPVSTSNGQGRSANSMKPAIYQASDMPADPPFPFYSQTVSLYRPLFPIGWDKPVTSCQYQHLQPLLNKYVPSLRGVLLDYKNSTLGSNPGRQDAATDDDALTTVMCHNEYAVGYGWITADVELFVPSRGAFMEGSINLQTEGHIGVVCFGRFNASIEARRLPSAWKWVSNESPEAQGVEETASVITADDHGVVRQIHSTGFWVDGEGEKVRGKIRFRIRNFDAGTSGETSYLSLEGTMLDRESERSLVEEEAGIAQMRREEKNGVRRESRRAPDFSMTRFAADGADAAEEAEAHKSWPARRPEDRNQVVTE